ncbi:MAG: MBL fold metallo-hydrolase [Cyanobacteriota bacterium]
MSQNRPITSDSLEKLTCFPFGIGENSQGICLLVQMGSSRILLDCGLSDISPLITESKPPADLVVCSHAHRDHAQGLLALHRAFPEMPIYTSEVTAQLLSLNWQEELNSQAVDFCSVLPWRSPFQFSDTLSLELFPAGHLPGATVIALTYSSPKRTYRLIYTGDFFLSNSRLVEGLALQSLRSGTVDVLIVESTYGATRHIHRRQQENLLMDQINHAIANHRSVLIPVPPFGLAQEILVLLRSHHQFTGRNLDIWVDSSITTACNIYLKLLPHLRESLQNFAKHQPLFWDERVRPRMFPISDTQQPNPREAPCVILTDLTTNLQQYCSPDTGSWLILLPQEPRFSLPPSLEALIATSDPDRIQFETYLLAQHSDGVGTTQLIHNLRPQHVVFVHGSASDRADLTSLEELQSRYQLHSPAAETLVELPIGETFIRPAAPTTTETNYEGEIHEVGSTVHINLPDVITNDPRWSNFSDTGLIEARWQGEELTLRGLSQRELLSQNSDAKIPANIACCGNCRHFRSQRCANPASPLYGFKVTPEGYCPVFDSIASNSDL